MTHGTKGFCVTENNGSQVQLCWEMTLGMRPKGEEALYKKSEKTPFYTRGARKTKEL